MRKTINVKDYIGKTFNHLTILSYDHTETVYTKNNRYIKKYVRCKCDCGNECITILSNVIHGITKSCGHLKKESYSHLLEINTTHGMSKTHIFKVWQGMRYRCNNPNSSDYYKYGGRGISVCDAWNNSFIEFYNWSISVGYIEQPNYTPYGERLSIERIDPNGNYEPNNCRWIPFKDQAKNKRNTLFVIDYDGEKLTLSDIARKYNVRPKTVYNLKHNKNWKWSIDMIVFYLHNQHLKMVIDHDTKKYTLVDSNGFKVLIPTIDFILRKNNIKKEYGVY